MYRNKVYEYHPCTKHIDDNAYLYNLICVYYCIFPFISLIITRTSLFTKVYHYAIVQKYNENVYTNMD